MMDINIISTRLSQYQKVHYTKQGYRGKIPKANIECEGFGQMGCNLDKLEIFIKISDEGIIEFISYQTTNACSVMDSIAYAWCKLSKDKMLHEINRITIDTISKELDLLNDRDMGITKDEIYIIHFNSVLDIMDKVIHEYQEKGFGDKGKLCIREKQKSYY
jgi:NifU-like protein involved in Fe-S cluster formation